MDIMKLMKQANKLKSMQKEISKIAVKEELDGAVLVINGLGEVQKLEISEELYERGRESLEKTMTSLLKSCLKKQTELQKEKAKEAMGGLNLPDILG